MMGNKNQGFLSASQIRAARGIIDWSQEDLAAASNLSIATVRKLELGYISPRSATTQHIRQAFEDAGLEFIEPDGVRRRPEDITVYEGHDGACAFFDDVYDTAKRKGYTEIVQVWPTSGLFSRVIGDYKTIHYTRMTAIQDSVSVKSIITNSTDMSFAAPYCKCRWLSKQYVDSVPFYIYGDKYAIIATDSDPFPKITVIQSRSVANAFRQQFYSMWEKATPLNVLDGTENQKKPTKRRA